MGPGWQTDSFRQDKHKKQNMKMVNTHDDRKGKAMEKMVFPA